MALDQTLKDWLDKLQAEHKLPRASDAADAAQTALSRGLEALEGPAPELAEVRPVKVRGGAGELDARLYVPIAAGVPPGPGLVFYHGGGFMIGDLATYDRLCRRIAAASCVRVLSVAYRMAPDHVFPAAVEDALAAFDDAAGARAAEFGFDPARVAVAGDSAGANLSAVVCQQRKDADVRPAFQWLIYPLMQLRETNEGRQKVMEGHLMSTAILKTIQKTYLADPRDADDVRASPMFFDDLKGQPPALVITTGLDPLQYEGKAYADRLAAAGVPVTYEHYPNYPHGFLQMTAVLDAARQAIVKHGRQLGEALGAPVNAAV